MRVKSIDDLPKAMRAQAAASVAANRSIAVPRTPVAPRQSKYGSVETESHGLTFKSKWEAQRYGELLMMERAELIRDLQVHQTFGLHVRAPNGGLVRVAGYEADFVYWRGDPMIVEDTKSKATRLKEAYVLKRRWFEAEYGIRILEVERYKPRPGADT